MNDFWNNILRYPRFFISSLAGLILIILSPLKNLFKNKNLWFISLVLILICISFIYLIIIDMTSI